MMSEHLATPGKHVQIVSVGHSGSSLLNLLLGAHASVISVGEIWSLQEMWDTEYCSCGARLNACEFWNRVTERIAHDRQLHVDELRDAFPLRGGVLRRRRGSRILWPSDLFVASGRGGLVKAAARVLPALARSLEAAEANLNYLAEAASVGDRPIVVDSSKNPLRAVLLYLLDPASFRMIRLVRDGRAVARSWMKAYGTPTYRQAALQWYLRDRLVHLCLQGIPEDVIFRLRYEDLCARPESTLRDLCEFIEVDYEPGMLLYQDTRCHDVHINPRPLNTKDQAVELDEKWRRTVPASDLCTFDRIAGRWNRRHGYGD